MALLTCEHIAKTFPARRFAAGFSGSVRALDDVSLAVERGESFGIVGESGSGKTTLGKVILGAVRPDAGTVALATKRVQAIFQDPQSSLDPRMKVADILAEGLIVTNERCDRQARIEEALDHVLLPKSALKKYPHQFSGGERQRIAIGRALVTDPEFIVCDEPVSSLDVTVQVEILRLLKTVQRERGMTYLFISHDLRVVKFMCERVAVMQEGKIVEQGPLSAVYGHPTHPYTKNLLLSVLDIYLKK